MRRRWPVAAVGLLLLLPGCQAADPPRDRGAASPPSVVPTQTTAAAAPTSPPSARASAAALADGPTTPGDPYGFRRTPRFDAAYLACTRQLGSDALWAEVIRDKSGRHFLVKTGVDVPARVHGPCVVELGGIDPKTSSYGRPA